MANRNDRRTRTTRGYSTRPSRASTRASSRAPSSRQTASRTRTARSRKSQPLDAQPTPQIHVEAGGRYEGPLPEGQQPELVSTSVGELRRADRAKRMRRTSRRYMARFIVIIGIVVALIVGWAALYNSPAFTIQNVQVNGVEHLTSSEMSQLANVPAGSTLLRVDTENIRNRMMQTAWVEDAQVKRVFPSTLEINVTERSIKAVVEIPTSSGSAVKQWAIAEDHIWLMPIPDAGSDAAKTTSSRIYEDAESALHIVDVPFGTKAEIGKECVDNNVNNALDIVSGMTTELADHVVKVSAAGPSETTLILDSGVEVAFGKAEYIRDKERVILQIMKDNQDNVAYINVRMVETPTWRSV